jgi:hypothetical protein
MRRVAAFVLVGGALALALGAGAGYGANSKASCNGILVSSAAGSPGLVADLTREFHQIAKDLGLPPGVVVDAPGGQLHAGSVEACLEVLGG